VLKNTASTTPRKSRFFREKFADKFPFQIFRGFPSSPEKEEKIGRSTRFDPGRFLSLLGPLVHPTKDIYADSDPPGTEPPFSPAFPRPCPLKGRLLGLSTNPYHKHIDPSLILFLLVVMQYSLSVLLFFPPNRCLFPPLWVTLQAPPFKSDAASGPIPLAGISVVRQRQPELDRLLSEICSPRSLGFPTLWMKFLVGGISCPESSFDHFSFPYVPPFF